MAQTTQLDPENPFFEVFVCPELGILRCGGIEIFGEFDISSSNTFLIHLSLNTFHFYSTFILN